MISQTQWKKMLSASAEILCENSTELCHIDSQIGDGDHGVTIKKIAELILREIQVDYDSAASLLETVGFGVTNIQGGSAGPLWGTFFMGMSGVLESNPDASFSQIIAGGLSELQTISTAKVGDKTMMDAIYPAVEAAQTASNDSEALEKAAQAAHLGAEKTSEYVAKFGRAKNYGERSLGVRDAGACSIALLFKGMNTGYHT